MRVCTCSADLLQFTVGTMLRGFKAMRQSTSSPNELCSLYGIPKTFTFVPLEHRRTMLFPFSLSGRNLPAMPPFSPVSIQPVGRKATMCENCFVSPPMQLFCLRSKSGSVLKFKLDIGTIKISASFFLEVRVCAERRRCENELSGLV